MLYTLGCHLCDEAESIVVEFNHVMHEYQFQLTVKKQDIAESEALVEQYGLKIPVVVDAASGKELCWPFDVEQLYHFLRDNSY